MTDAVTSPDEHIFFACDMGPTRNSVLVGERKREREREPERKTGFHLAYFHVAEVKIDF